MSVHIDIYSDIAISFTPYKIYTKTNTDQNKNYVLISAGQFLKACENETKVILSENYDIDFSAINGAL